MMHSLAIPVCFLLPAIVASEASAQRRSAPARVTSANHQALREPTAQGFVNAVQVYPWSAGAVYSVYAAPERVSDVILQPGETLVSVAAGDTARWTIGDTTSGSGEGKRTHILIKPFAAGLRTNVVIATDRRVYHLQLESTAKTAMTALSWTYPQDALLAVAKPRVEPEVAAPVAAGLQLEALRFGYQVTGDTPAWRPLRAFDDGRQTFIEFPADIASGEAPPLFVVGPKGATELVNYRVSGRYYVVDRLFDAAELRLGTSPQRVVRIKRTAAAGSRQRSAS